MEIASTSKPVPVQSELQRDAQPVEVVQPHNATAVSSSARTFFQPNELTFLQDLGEGIANEPLPPVPSVGFPGNVHSASTEISLPPNYPPVVYPPIVPHRTYATKTIEKMEIVGQSESNCDENDSMEEDASSEVSEGEDLKVGSFLHPTATLYGSPYYHQGDLEEALQGDFDFKGNYAFATPLPQAPNPGLHIEDLGLIGLPLSERDAKLIMGCAVQAPFGHGERTVVDTNVRDTFEVEPAKVSFQNPAWDFYVKDLVTRSIWPELGVGVYTTVPRCELYKLLLYQTGSQCVSYIARTRRC